MQHFTSFLLAFVPFFVQAQSVSWDFTGNVFTGTASNPNITPVAATLGAGVGHSGFPDAECSGEEPWSVNSWDNSDSENDAINGNYYVEFTVNVAPGFKFTVTSFSFNSNRSVNSDGDLFGPLNWFVRSSSNGYGSNLGSGTNPNGTTGAGASCQFNSIPCNIVVNGGQSLTFRIYAYGEVNNNTPTMRIDNVDISGTVLPIELLRFEAAHNKHTTLLSWSTATERNNAYFSVERSADGRQFSEIGRVAGAGTSNEVREYRFADERPLRGMNYYRLKQVDFDGRFEYSPLRSVLFGPAGRLTLSPSPAAEHLRIQLDAPVLEEGRWWLFDAAGRLFKDGVWGAESDYSEIGLAGLPEGVYIFRLVSGRDLYVQTFIRQ